MADILVLHFTEENRLPSLNEKEREDIKLGIDKIAKDYPDVEFKGTYVDENGIGVCYWTAPSVEVIEEIEGKIGEEVLGTEPPVDKIIEVKRVL